MTAITFNPTSLTQLVNWDTASLWSPEVVPDSGDDAVVVPEIDSDGSLYSFLLTIGGGDAYTVGSLDIDSPNSLAIDGSLSVLGDFATMGDVEVYTSLNAGSLEVSDLYLPGQGTVSVSGALTVSNSLGGANSTVSANRLELAGELAASGGTLTIDIGAGGFSYLDDGVLTGGAYAANIENGVASELNLNVGGVPTVLGDATLNFDGGEIAFFDPAQQKYVSVEASLQTIAAGGVIKVSANATASFGALDDNGAIELDDGTFAASGLHIGAEGTLIGGGVLDASTINDGVIATGTGDDAINNLVVDGAVSGSGYLQIYGYDIPSDGYEPAYYYGGSITLANADSNNVVFAGETGALYLDDYADFTGKISGVLPTGHVAGGMTIAIRGVSDSAVTGFAYSGDDSSGELVIHTTSGDIDLGFIGAFTTNDFALTAGPRGLSTLPPTLDVKVTPNTPPGPTVTGVATSETYFGEPAVSPFANVEIADGDALTVTVALGAPDDGALSLAGGSVAGLTSESYDAATGVFTMAGDASAVSAALQALAFAPNLSDVASGGQSDATLTLRVADADGSTTATTDVVDYNGPATIAEALSSAGATKVVDTSADLQALTAQQIAALAALGVGSIGSDDDDVVYNQAQSDALASAAIKISAPANDYASEHFVDHVVRYQFDADDNLNERVTVEGDRIDRQFPQTGGSIAGVSYASHDLQLIDGQRTYGYFYSATGALVASETFLTPTLLQITPVAEPEVYRFLGGAAGGDTVHFAKGFGSAVVRGFAAGDVVDVAPLFASFSAAQGAMTEAGGSTLIRDTAGDSLRIVGVTPGQLTSAELGF